MNSFILSAFVAALVTLASCRPGHHAYNLGYGFVAAGYGGHHHGGTYGGHGGYGHHQPGVAKVQSHQTGHDYQYALNEHGPHYNKHVHQEAAFHHTVPVAVPVAAHYGHGHGHAGYGHAAAFAVAPHHGGYAAAPLGHLGGHHGGYAVAAPLHHGHAY